MFAVWEELADDVPEEAGRLIRAGLVLLRQAVAVMLDDLEPQDGDPPVGPGSEVRGRG